MLCMAGSYGGKLCMVGRYEVMVGRYGGTLWWDVMVGRYGG